MDSCANTNEADMETRLVEEEAEPITLEELLFALPDPHGELVSDLENEINSFRIAAAPYKKLPAELFAEIFLLCATLPVSLPPKTDEPLLILLQVCSSWRKMALQVPELWASISVSFTEVNTVERITGIAEQWISRAGAEYPLSITTDCTGPFATLACESPAVVSGFVPLVLANSRRMRHFNLALPFDALKPLFELPRGAFPCLETMALQPLLVLEDMGKPETYQWPSTSVAFESAPALREVMYNPLSLFRLADVETIREDVTERIVTTSEPSHPFFAPPFALPLVQLSVLKFPFTTWTADAWCVLLTECPTLVHLEVATQPSPSTEPPSNSPQLTHMDFLEHLSVYAFGGGGEELTDRLVTPRLTAFVLMGLHFPPAALISFHERSNFTLHTFVPVVLIPSEDVARIFQRFADLKVLSILAVSTEQFPAAFWEAVGRGETLPHLETLLIRPTAAQAPVLVDMIAARWEAAEAGVGPRFEVSFCDVRPMNLDAINDELRRLEKYKEGGRAVGVVTFC
ncbi:hypothetical protein B0H11DRAFT_246892 [Mycena galericulata]|nr:hypothetical protein B0H11DRAFT_246892 [Mycena galericulata]